MGSITQGPLTTGFQQSRGTEDGRRKVYRVISSFLPSSFAEAQIVAAFLHN